MHARFPLFRMHARFPRFRMHARFPTHSHVFVTGEDASPRHGAHSFAWESFVAAQVAASKTWAVNSVEGFQFVIDKQIQNDGENKQNENENENEEQEEQNKAQNQQEDLEGGELWLLFKP